MTDFCLGIDGNQEFDNSYLEDFRRVLWNITDEEELVRQLPNSRFHGYVELLLYLIKYSEEEINVILEELACATEEEDIDYLKRDLEFSRRRIMLFSKKLEEEKGLIEEQTASDKGINERKLIYLKSKAGNCVVESDIEDIPINELSNMYAAFMFLRNGDFTSDPTKYKSLTNNRNLKGVREVKNAQARIYFYHIEKDITLVFLALEKKGDDPKREKERILKRAQAMYDYLPIVFEKLKNPIQREQLLEEGAIITSSIEKRLNPDKKMGGK